MAVVVVVAMVVVVVVVAVVVVVVVVVAVVMIRIVTIHTPVAFASDDCDIMLMTRHLQWHLSARLPSLPTAQYAPPHHHHELFFGNNFMARTGTG